MTKRGEEKSPQLSFFALFAVLKDVQSQIILVCGMLFAIAAGAPLPIIGVIFSKIINSFPPSEAEVDKRVYQLLAVGMYLNTKRFRTH